MPRLIVLALLPALLALEPADGQETRAARPEQPSPPAQLADLAWLAGAWAGEGIAGPARETYSPIIGNAIAGHFVQQRGDGVFFYEIMTIVPRNGSLVYRLKHFNADLSGWEEKDEVREFRLVAHEGDSWYFDDLTIRRDGPGHMTGIVNVREKDGTSREIAFHYVRVSPDLGD